MATPADEAANDDGSGPPVSFRSRINRAFGRISIKFLSLVLFLWSGSLMARRPLSSPIVAMNAQRHHPPFSFENIGRRRCIGQFLASYNLDVDSDYENSKEMKRDGSVMHWINENTSCDLPTKPFKTFFKRRKKYLDKNGSRTKIMTDNGEEEDPYHVVMLLMDYQEIHHEVIAMSAGYLMAGLEVTIIYIFQDNGTSETPTPEENWAIPYLIQLELFKRLPPNDNVLQRAQDSFRFVGMNLNDYFLCSYKAAPSHPLDSCSIAMAPAVLKLLLNEMPLQIPPTTIGSDGTKRFDFVLMMDASFLGGLLFSEIKMIPSIAIGSHNTLMFAVEQEPNWNPSPNRKTLDRMDMVFLQRIYSLGLTGGFLKANQLRHSLGMKRLKTPLDHLLPVVAILADLVPSDIVLPLSEDETYPNTHSHNGSHEKHSNENEERGYGYRFHNLQPLLPPCSLCLDAQSPTKVDTSAPIILVSPPTGVSAKWTRSLIRALSLTKQSLEGYDECLFDRATCRNGVAGFEVNWQGDDYFPPVPPSYVHREISDSLIDSAIRNPNTIIALIHCDSEASILAGFGIEVFCITQSNRIPTIDSVDDILHEKGYDYGSNVMDSSSKLLRESLSRENINSEEIATQLLTVLRRKSVGSQTSVDDGDSLEKKNREMATWVTSGMQRALTIVQTTARLHRKNSWKDPRQMQRVTSSGITKALNLIDRGEDIKQAKNNWQDFGMKQDIDAIFTVVLACLVFLSASIFIILKDSVPMKRWRHHRRHHYYRNGGTIFDSFLNRLDDLEKAWDMFVSWSSQFSTAKLTVDSHGDRIGRSKSNENSGNNTRKDQQPQHNNNHHQSQMRRRRKTKTTR